MKDIEKNDVDVKKLFEWSDVITIFDRKGNPISDFHLKVIGEADWNRSRVWALRDSSELRKKLKTEGSDERLAYVQEREDMEKSILVEYLILLSMRDYTNEAIELVSIPFPTPPKSDATLEQQEIYQAKIDKYAEEREAKLRKEIQKIVKKQREKFLDMEDDALHIYYETLTINELCRSEMNEKFLSYSTYFGTYKTEAFEERAFDTFEDFANIPMHVKTQIMNKYASLDMNAEDLKK